MPIEYAGGGVLAEHAAVRSGVGLFDVSHLGTATVRGPGAAAFVDSCLTNDLSRIGPGQAQYTLCCLPDGEAHAGGVVDDLIVYLHGPDDVLLVPNAANAAEVLRRLTEEAPDGVVVTDRHREVAVLAVQGPHSLQVLELLGLPGELSYMSFVTGTGGAGATVTVCRTGYTGEHGYELLVDAEHAGELWDAVLEAGQDLGIRPCGLGARDTLRTEMGYPLHGHELSADITPVQARAGWAVGWKKPAFWGREALLAEKEAGPARLLWGLRADGRGSPDPAWPCSPRRAAGGGGPPAALSPRAGGGASRPPSSTGPRRWGGAPGSASALGAGRGTGRPPARRSWSRTSVKRRTPSSP